MQIIRIIGMVLAVAGIIYALEYVPHTVGWWLWIWVVLLAIGFVGLLWSFRVMRRRQLSASRRSSSTALPAKKRR